ncbi:hypothetical protein CC78DRAFT_113733 [Lojkania enalia]|uniref:Uncharacterized protein n=1 Tax=Lojkania enalia TaxID=147567 RepID=A0A9P4JZ54_9PLEO|nr:hypothetical protein CC78DRAFT_113733 [Didymosphaeria enalia]
MACILSLSCTVECTLSLSSKFDINMRCEFGTRCGYNRLSVTAKYSICPRRVGDQLLVQNCDAHKGSQKRYARKILLLLEKFEFWVCRHRRVCDFLVCWVVREACLRPHYSTQFRVANNLLSYMDINKYNLGPWEPPNNSLWMQTSKAWKDKRESR